VLSGLSAFGLSGVELSALVVAALCVGFAKAAIGGVASISVALFAAVLPARESTGVLLPLLLVGDLVAVGAYRRHVDWATLLRLSPSVVVGVLVGVVFVARVDDTVMRRTIGAVLLMLVAVHLWQRRAGAAAPAVDPDSAAGRRSRHGTALFFGSLAGFTTMVANSGGAVMSLYLLSSGLSMLGFLGTAAWFFFILNMFKVPFSIGLDLIRPESLVLDAMLVPAVLLGALIGRFTIKRIDQSKFERAVLFFTVASSLNLLR
jgi:uncharacterized membrane protein YfcA